MAGGWWLAGYLVVLFYIGWGLVGDWLGIQLAGWLPGCVVAHLAVDAADTVFTCGPVFRVFRLAGGWWLAGYLVVSFYIGWGFRLVGGWLAGYLVVLFYIGWGWLGILVGDWLGIWVGDWLGI